jgi:FkbM family methyltransferase
VDVGAYDPIYASNTLGLVGWKGINVEADRDRHQNFLISRPNEINLNLAITNQTGGYATLVEYAEDSSASIHADLLKGMAAGSIKSKEQTVYQMTLADLCHKYYIKRPKLLNIDIEEHGYVALSSNDWTT